MKRSVILGVLALLIAVFSVSLPGNVQAGKAIFDASLVPVLFTTQSAPGVFKGGVKVFADATIQVNIVGAEPNATYNVMAGFLTVYDAPPLEYVIVWMPAAAGNSVALTLTTDEKGNGAATGWIAHTEGYPFIVFGLRAADGTYPYVTGAALY